MIGGVGDYTGGGGVERKGGALKVSMGENFYVDLIQF